MSLLKKIDELENVENLTHRAVLKAIRDTSFSMKEIAFHMKLGRTFIYYIVRRYLPQGYLQRRAQLLELQSMSRIAEERSKAEDRVLIVPAIDNKLSGESHRNEVTSDQKEQDRHPFPSP